MKTDIYTFYNKCVKELYVDESIVLVESHNGIDLAGNMLRMALQMSKLFTSKIYIVYVKENEERIRTLASGYKIENCNFVERESYLYFELLATLRYYLSDVAYYPLYQKKQGQICISTWHGTPLKTLGFDYMEDEYVVANQKRGFMLADYFVCPNEYTWNCINKSYQLGNLFNGKVLFMGYPRNETLLEGEKGDIRKYIDQRFESEKKKIIVYMPTWRGKVIETKSEEQTNLLKKYLKEIDDRLDSNYIVLAKLHRLNNLEIDFNEMNHTYAFPQDLDPYDILRCADILVTDYSSVMFDFEVTKKKIVLFTYDKEDYINNRCCYFDIDKLPFPIVDNVEQLLCELYKPKDYKDEKLIEYFNKHDELGATEQICNFIVNDSGKNKLKKNSIECLFFIGALEKSIETDVMFDEIDLYAKSKEISVTYLNHLFKKNWYKLLQVQRYNNIPFFMFQGSYIHYMEGEYDRVKSMRNQISNNEHINREDLIVLKQIYNREVRRFFYDCKVKCFIRYSGLDLDSLKYLISFDGKSILYIHYSMLFKANKNKEFREYLLEAAKCASELKFANRSIYIEFKPFIKEHKGKIIILNLY